MVGGVKLGGVETHPSLGWFAALSTAEVRKKVALPRQDTTRGGIYQPGRQRWGNHDTKGGVATIPKVG